MGAVVTEGAVVKDSQHFFLHLLTCHTQYISSTYYFHNILPSFSLTCLFVCLIFTTTTTHFPKTKLINNIYIIQPYFQKHIYSFSS